MPVKRGEGLSAAYLNGLEKNIKASRVILGGGTTGGETPDGVQLFQDASTDRRGDALYCLGVNMGGNILQPYKSYKIYQGPLSDPAGIGLYSGDHRIGLVGTSSEADNTAPFAVTTTKHGPYLALPVCYMGMTLALVIAESDTAATTKRARLSHAHPGLLLIADDGVADVIWEDASKPRTTAHIALVRIGGGGGTEIKTYNTFPDIPTKPTLISCKQQVWYAEQGYQKWYPLARFPSATGTPGT